jgi:hypothetical protein
MTGNASHSNATGKWPGEIDPRFGRGLHQSNQSLALII